MPPDVETEVKEGQTQEQVGQAATPGAPATEAAPPAEPDYKVLLEEQKQANQRLEQTVSTMRGDLRKRQDDTAFRVEMKASLERIERNTAARLQYREDPEALQAALAQNDAAYQGTVTAAQAQARAEAFWTDFTVALKDDARAVGLDYDTAPELAPARDAQAKGDFDVAWRLARQVMVGKPKAAVPAPAPKPQPKREPGELEMDTGRPGPGAGGRVARNYDAIVDDYITGRKTKDETNQLLEANGYPRFG